MERMSNCSLSQPIREPLRWEGPQIAGFPHGGGFGGRRNPSAPYLTCAQGTLQCLAGRECSMPLGMEKSIRKHRNAFGVEDPRPAMQTTPVHTSIEQCHFGPDPAAARRQIPQIEIADRKWVFDREWGHCCGGASLDSDEEKGCFLGPISHGAGVISHCARQEGITGV